MPSKIPNTGPPMIGTQRPNIMANTPTATASARPYRGDGARGAAPVRRPRPKNKSLGAETIEEEEIADTEVVAGAGSIILNRHLIITCSYFKQPITTRKLTNT